MLTPLSGLSLPATVSLCTTGSHVVVLLKLKLLPSLVLFVHSEHQGRRLAPLILCVLFQSRLLTTTFDFQIVDSNILGISQIVPQNEDAYLYLVEEAHLVRLPDFIKTPIQIEKEVRAGEDEVDEGEGVEEGELAERVRVEERGVFAALLTPACEDRRPVNKKD